jgi:hypothetical protein
MLRSFSGGLAAAMLALGVNSALADISASADVSTSQSSAPFNYNITLHNTGTTNIGSFWFAWNPTGYNFLPTQPLSVTAPANWSYTVTNLYPGYDGYGLEFVDNGAPIAPGGSLTGFQFTSDDTPTQIKSASPWYTQPPVTTSYVCIGTPQADPGALVNVTVVPEPAGLALAGIGAGLGWIVWRRPATKPPAEGAQRWIQLDRNSLGVFTAKTPFLCAGAPRMLYSSVL